MSKPAACKTYSLHAQCLCLMVYAADMLRNITMVAFKVAVAGQIQ